MQLNIDKFYTIKAYSVTYRYNEATGAPEIASEKVANYKGCESLNDPIIDDLIERITNGDSSGDVMKCPDLQGDSSLGEVLVQNGQKDTFKRFVVKIYPCSLPNPAECAPAMMMPTMFIHMSNVRNLIRSGNYTDPKRAISYIETFQHNPVAHNVHFYLSKMTRIVDFRNRWSGEVEREKFVSSNLVGQDSQSRDGSVLHCDPGTLGMGGSCPEYMTFQFDGGHEMEVVRRTYKTPTQIVGEIGGILKLVTVLAVIYSIYNENKKIKFFGSQLFGVLASRVLRRGKSGLGGGLMAGRRKEQAKLEEKSENRKNQIIFSEPVSRLNKVHAVKSGGGVKAGKVVVEQLAKDRSCVTHMMKSLNFLDLLGEFTLDEDARMLLPLAIIAKEQFGKRSKAHQQEHPRGHQKGSQQGEIDQEDSSGHDSGAEDQKLDETRKNNLQDLFRQFIEIQAGLKRKPAKKNSQKQKSRSRSGGDPSVKIFSKRSRFSQLSKNRNQKNREEPQRAEENSWEVIGSSEREKSSKSIKIEHKEENLKNLIEEDLSISSRQGRGGSKDVSRRSRFSGSSRKSSSHFKREDEKQPKSKFSRRSILR